MARIPTKKNLESYPTFFDKIMAVPLKKDVYAKARIICNLDGKCAPYYAHALFMRIFLEWAKTIRETYGDNVRLFFKEIEGQTFYIN